jgi:hypothetical protein
MKIDLYTKTVLTGILGCLLWLCAMHTPVATPLQAQLGPTSVIIAGYASAGGTHGLDSGLPVRSVGVVGSTSTAPMPLTSSPAPRAAAPTSEAAPAYSGMEATSARCQATTQKGSQCKRNAKTGSRYCWQHGG